MDGAGRCIEIFFVIFGYRRSSNWATVGSSVRQTEFCYRPNAVTDTSEIEGRSELKIKQPKNRAVFIAATATVMSLAAPAGAATALTVGPGDPIRSPMPENTFENNRWVGAPMCSASVPGTIVDQSGNSKNVLLTAGHCVNTSSDIPTLPAVTGDVYAPTRAGDVKIGHAGPHAFTIPADGTEVVDIFDALNGSDYGFIELEPGVAGTSISTSTDENGSATSEGVQMVGIVDYPALQMGEVAFDNFGQPICKDGNRTGRTCGVQLLRGRNGVWSVMTLDHGDSGGNAFNPVTREVIGVNSMVLGPFARVAPADVAVEDAYGVPDGQVNEKFKITDSTAPRSDEYRTLGEDAAANAAAEEPITLNELLKGIWY